MIKQVGLYDLKGDVTNTIVIDTEKEFNPPEGLTIIDDVDSAIGDTVVDGVLVKAEPSEPLQQTEGV